jgi:hypothetical protein
MTIKALSGISTISELTTELLRKMIFNVNELLPYPLVDLNLRFKSYTMIFTKNGPLYNDKKYGKIIYQKLLIKIIDGFETIGDKKCDITGLNYSTTFAQFLLDTMLELGIPKQEALKKDLTINRCWFPLLGGLGSDAQSLPMSKYTYNVHPICIVLLQFLTFSSLIYKRNLLLVDSVNFDLCEYFIKDNTNYVLKKAGMTPTKDKIDNIKDFAKGNYILKVLDIMQDVKLDYNIIDLNLWSFSNSGNGANCSIDRIPNSLLSRLEQLYIKNTAELSCILKNQFYSNSFLECLNDSKDWFGLYPSKNSAGVSVNFFESYFIVTGQKMKTEIAKYIVFLISKYKNESFDDILEKTDAYDFKKYNYEAQFNLVLLKATRNNEWSMDYQIEILNDIERIPIFFSASNIYKLVHFYYLKNALLSDKPTLHTQHSPVCSFCNRIINLIFQEQEKDQINVIKRILGYNYVTDKQETDKTIFDELLIRHANEDDVNIFNLFPLLYSNQGYKNISGLCLLLKYYYSNPKISSTTVKGARFPKLEINPEYYNWLNTIENFIENYIEYRLKNVVIEEKRPSLLKKIYRSIPKFDTKAQYLWFNTIWNKYNDDNPDNGFSEEDFIYNPDGVHSFSFFMFAFRMKFNEMILNNINN